MISILFVCTGNSCRSPLAEALARREWRALGEGLEVASAGLHASAGGPASTAAQEIASERGLDLGGHRSRELNAALLDRADLVITMGARHKDEILGRYPESRGKVYTLSEFSGLDLGDVADPWGGDLEDYRRTFELLQRHFESATQNLRSFLE